MMMKMTNGKMTNAVIMKNYLKMILVMRIMIKATATTIIIFTMMTHLKMEPNYTLVILASVNFLIKISTTFTCLNIEPVAWKVALLQHMKRL